MLLGERSGLGEGHRADHHDRGAPRLPAILVERDEIVARDALDGPREALRRAAIRVIGPEREDGAHA